MLQLLLAAALLISCSAPEAVPNSPAVLPTQAAVQQPAALPPQATLQSGLLAVSFATDKASYAPGETIQITGQLGCEQLATGFGDAAQAFWDKDGFLFVFYLRDAQGQVVAKASAQLTEELPKVMRPGDSSAFRAVMSAETLPAGTYSLEGNLSGGLYTETTKDPLDLRTQRIRFDVPIQIA